MADKPRTTINYSVLVETEAMIKELCADTMRNPGNLIDFVVADAYSRAKKAARENTTVEEAMLSQEGG